MPRNRHRIASHSASLAPLAPLLRLARPHSSIPPPVNAHAWRRLGMVGGLLLLLFGCFALLYAPLYMGRLPLDSYQ
jgi:hypothetical protein